MPFKTLESLNPLRLRVLKDDINSKLNTVIVENKTMSELMQETAFQKIADYYNEATSTDLWIPNLNPKDLNEHLVMTEFQALSIQKQNGWFAMIGGNEVNASRPSVRANFATIFGPNSATTNNLVSAAKRKATRFELLSSFGQNTGGVWASSVFGYNVTFNDIESAIRL